MRCGPGSCGLPSSSTFGAETEVGKYRVRDCLSVGRKSIVSSREGFEAIFEKKGGARLLIRCSAASSPIESKKSRQRIAIPGSDSIGEENRRSAAKRHLHVPTCQSSFPSTRLFPYPFPFPFPISIRALHDALFSSLGASSLSVSGVTPRAHSSSHDFGVSGSSKQSGSRVRSSSYPDVCRSFEPDARSLCFTSLKGSGRRDVERETPFGSFGFGLPETRCRVDGEWKEGRSDGQVSERKRERERDMPSLKGSLGSRFTKGFGYAID